MSPITRLRNNAQFKLMIKLVLVFGLLAFLAKKGFLSLEATQRALEAWPLLLAAFLLLLSNNLWGILRWQLLLRAQGIFLPWKTVIELNFIGIFFNIALPGAVSGDFVKAIYVARESPGNRSKAFSSIFFDRIVGVSALVLVSAVSLAISLSSDWGASLLPPLKWFVIGTGAGVIVFYTYLFTVAEHRDPVSLFFKWLEQKSPKAGALRRIYDSFRVYHHHPGAVFWGSVFSVAVHLSSITACSMFLKALGAETDHLLALYVVVPLGFLVTAIPIFPAGVGTGHAAFIALFQLLHSDRGADVFNLYVVSQLLVSALGGLVYLRFKGSHQPAETLLAEEAQL